MIPLWNALDRKFQVLYIYVIKCTAGVSRGPYLHKKRTGRIYLLSGAVEITYRENGNKQFTKVILKEEEKQTLVLDIPNMTEYTITAIKDSILINLCNYPWNEFENETEKLNDSSL